MLEPGTVVVLNSLWRMQCYKASQVGKNTARLSVLQPYPLNYTLNCFSACCVNMQMIQARISQALTAALWAALYHLNQNTLKKSVNDINH